jgi:adenosylmethionine-8-amino-7-oxononanoate aminotransferase
MNSKNPFEIRLEILKMAKEMMDTSYQDAMNGWWNMASSYAESANKTTEDFLKQSEELMKSKPAMYTPKDMMEKAQELYSFVAKKD